MTTAVSICNEALLILGEPIVATLPQTGSKGSVILNIMYETRRDYLLRSYVWGFAKGRAILAPTAIAPLFDWSYAFNLPTDYMNLIKTDHIQDGTYAIEGKQILSNDNVLYLNYVKRITDPNTFDPMFVLALAALLARDSSENITGSYSKTAGAMYDQYISEARNIDSIERDAIVIKASDWEESRL